MPYYRLHDRLRPDSALLYQRSAVETRTGMPLIDYSEEEGGVPFQGPFDCELEIEPDGHLPDLFLSPALITTRRLADDLQAVGGIAMQTLPVRLLDEAGNVVRADYVLVNLLQRVSCAVLAASDYQCLDAGEGHEPTALRVIDRLVLDPVAAAGHECFLVDEDTDCIVVSARIAAALQACGHPDLWFEALAESPAGA